MNTKASYDWLRSAGKNIVAFSDGNSALWGREFYGIACIPPDTLPVENALVVVVVLGRSAPAVSQYLSKQSFDFEYIAVPIYESNRSKLERFRNYLSDANRLKFLIYSLGRKQR
jgi:hypothetical protein